jgi:spore coat polysaccharide biosynthesis protein SpsF
MSSKTEMRLVAIIQARMGSTRLPGKVLLPLAGRPVLEHVVQRVRDAGVFSEVVVATSVSSADDAIEQRATRIGVATVRGSESDVLSRYGAAAQATHAEAIARITADCPLIDPVVLADMSSRFLAGQGAPGAADLVTNARIRTYPRGLDAEFFTRTSLDMMLAEALAPHHREHVTPFLYEHPERFVIVDHVASRDLSEHRWTLDTPDDYALLQRIFDAGGPSPLRLENVIALLDANPEWRHLNAHVRQKATH